MKLKRVLVADDHAPLLTAVAALLGSSFDIVGMVSDGQSALDAILGLEPDVAILDISMPCKNGLEVAGELKNHGCMTKIVFLTVLEDSAVMAACISAGALGYVYKGSMGSDLIPAMNAALAGRVFVSHIAS